MKEEKIIWIKRNKIKPDPKNPRKGMVDQEELKKMAETFKHHSIIAPIEIDEKNMIITGEMRWRSAEIAEMDEVPCIIKKGLTPEQRLERQLIENIHRQKVDLGECVDELKILLNSLLGTKERKINNDEGITELSNRLGVNRDWLSQILQIEKAPKKIKKEVDKYYETRKRPEPERKGISASQAVEIVKAPKIIQDDLLERAKAKVPSKSLRKTRLDFEKNKIELDDIRKKKFAENEPNVFDYEPDPLNFRKEHINMILNGKKIQTTRFWHRAKIGDKVPIHLHEPNIAKVEIIENDNKKLKDFTEEDAKREGGYSLKEFKEVWKKIHKKWNPEAEVKVFQFKLIK